MTFKIEEVGLRSVVSIRYPNSSITSAFLAIFFAALLKDYRVDLCNLYLEAGRPGGDDVWRDFSLLLK